MLTPSKNSGVRKKGAGPVRAGKNRFSSKRKNAKNKNIDIILLIISPRFFYY